MRARPGGHTAHRERSERIGVLTPQLVVKGVNIPCKAVVRFFAEVIDSIAGQGRARVLSVLRSAHGEHPVCEIEFGGERLAVFVRL